MNVTLADELLERRRDSTDIAVVDLGTGEQVSYRTLARRVQALTDLLAGLGVGRGGTVALLTDKSAASVAVMWAALRLGARYVPLDESLPAARIGLLLGKCAPTVTVVGPAHRELLDGAPAGKVVVVGADPVDDGLGWDPSA
ncbi:AMP-binding protein, partial [Streptomyces hydrogenans]